MEEAEEEKQGSGKESAREDVKICPLLIKRGVSIFWQFDCGELYHSIDVPVQRGAATVGFCTTYFCTVHMLQQDETGRGNNWRWGGGGRGGKRPTDFEGCGRDGGGVRGEKGVGMSRGALSSSSSPAFIPSSSFSLFSSLLWYQGDLDTNGSDVGNLFRSGSGEGGGGTEGSFLLSLSMVKCSHEGGIRQRRCMHASERN